MSKLKPMDSMDAETIIILHKAIRDDLVIRFAERLGYSGNSVKELKQILNRAHVDLTRR